METEDYETKLDQLQLEIEEAEEIAPIKKVKKKRKPMTAEHKAKCMASLKKAREASQLKRGKKAKAKKIMKEKDDEEVDKILDLHIKAKAEKEEAKDKEIAALKKQLNSLTLQDIIPKPPPQPKRVESVADHEPASEAVEPASEAVASEAVEPEPASEAVEPEVLPPPPPMRTSQPSILVQPLAPKKVVSKSIPSIRHHIVRPKMKPRT